jgi:cation/acetate symporter
MIAGVPIQIVPEGLDIGFKLIPAITVFLMLALFLGVGLFFRVADVEDLWVAGRGIGNIENGMAIGANWMSAASYLGVAASIALLGYFGLAYLVGWTTGYFILLIFLAAQFRRFGKYTAPDFVGDRFYSETGRGIAAVTTLVIAYVYAVSQARGMGLMSMYVFGTSYEVGVIILMSITIVYVALSGMLGTTKNMAIQYIILISAFIVGLYAVGWTQGYSTVMPFLEFGTEATYVSEMVAAEFTEPFANAGYYEWVALAFTLIVGTCGLPHVLVRFYTVDNERTARWSCVWGLFFICLLYWGTAAYAAFGTVLFDETAGLEFPFSGDQGDVVVVLTAQLAGLPEWLVGLVAAGGIAAALATTAGLFVSGSSAAAHDIYTNLYKEDASQREQVLVGRATIVGLGILVTITGVINVGLIAALVAAAFAIAGNVMFPVFFLGLWWERTTREGALAGMTFGLLVSVVTIFNEFGAQGVGRETPFVPELAAAIPATSSSLVTVPIVFAIIIGVSLVTEDPPDHIKRMVRQCHSPKPMSKMQSAEEVAATDGGESTAASEHGSTED